MAKEFVVLLALMATATARPDPQFIYSGADAFYNGALSAYTAPVVAPVVPASIPTAAVSSLYPLNLPGISAYAYQSNVIGDALSSNLVYPYSSVSYLTSNLPYSSLSYPNLPYPNLSYLSYRR